FALAERFPLGILGAVEDLGQVARLVELGEALEVEQVGSGSAYKRGVRLGGDVRNAIEQGQIFGMFSELVISDQGAERRSAENSVFFFVNFLEQSALIELGGFLDIP